MKKILIWRWTFFIVGIMVLSLGISMTIKGQRFGVGPWDVLHIGLHQSFGMTIGTWGIITGFLIIAGTATVLKELPKIGTWLNMILIGLFIDLFNWMLPDVETFGAQMFIFVLGLLVSGYGVGIYVSPNIGAGPRDSLMLLFVEKFGVSVKIARTTLEVTVALLGWLLGGPVGIGTVIIALFIGQIVHYALPQCRKLLMKLIGETDEDSLFKINLLEKT